MITESEYDSYNFNNVENISVESKFTGFKIDELLSSMNINTEYGDIFIKHVSKNFNKLKVDNKFGNIKIAIDSDASYNLVSDTEFCEIKFPKGDVRKSIKDDFKKYYEVKIGNENPVSSVKIISKHGNVDLME
jgi:formylmethanofuran dehydrogenase subunit A